MADRNHLSDGEIRIGWVLHEDSQPDEAPIPAILRRAERRVSLTIPFSPSELDEATARWFSGRSVQYSDDPDFEKFRYEPPSAFLFSDARGVVGLFDCRSLGSRSTLGGAGEGRLDVGFGVFGAKSLEYSHPTRVRTFIPGMGRWTGLGAISTSSTYAPSGLATEVKVETHPVEPVELCEGVSLQTSWSLTRRDSDNFVELSDPPFVESRYEVGRPLAEHLVIHQVFQELVDIAYWLPTGYNRIECHLEGDNALKTARNWRRVETNFVRYQDRNHEDTGMPLYYFQEIGPEGFRRWQTLRKVAGKAIAPLMTLLDIRNGSLEMQFIQSCVGLEGLGVHLLREAGRYKRSTALRDRLKEITASLGFSFSDDWHTRTADLYNDLKHYDRDAVTDPVEIWHNLLENQLVFRAWAAMQVGVAAEAVEDRIQYTDAAQQLVGKPNYRFKHYPRPFGR